MTSKIKVNTYRKRNENCKMEVSQHMYMVVKPRVYLGGKQFTVIKISISENETVYMLPSGLKLIVRKPTEEDRRFFEGAKLVSVME